MNPLIKEIIYKKGRTTTEFGATIITGLVAGAAALGIFDVSGETIDTAVSVAGQVVDNVSEGVQTIKEVKSGSTGIVDGLIRIAGLIIGGQVASTYIKARSDTKGAAIINYLRKIDEIQKNQNLEESKNEPTL